MDIELIKGLKDLKTGALLNLMGILLVFIGIGVMTATFGFTPMEEIKPEKFLYMMSVFGVFAFLLLAAIILSIGSFIMYFRATGHLSNYDEKFGIGRKGLVLEIAGVILFLISILPMVVTGAAWKGNYASGAIMATLGILFIGAILLIVGAVLFGIMLMRLEEVEKDFKVVGILYFAGMILGIFTGIIGVLIGIATTVLIYISAKSALRRLSIA